jgi:hypothetical protein
VRRELVHTAEDLLLDLLGEVHAFALGDHLQRRGAYSPEV